MKVIKLLIASLFLAGSIFAQTNQDLIVGNWQVDSAFATLGNALTFQDVTGMQELSTTMSQEEWEATFGISLPQSEVEWYSLVDSIISYQYFTNDQLQIWAIQYTQDSMLVYDEDGGVDLSYEFVNDTLISVVGPLGFPFSSFELISLNETNLTYYAAGGYGAGELFLTVYAHAVDEIIFGCLDEEAENYNSEAMADDGSCEYPYECMENELMLEMFDSYGDGWNGSELIINNISYTLATGPYDFVCISEASCYMFSSVEGSYAFEASFEVVNANDELLYSGGIPFSLNDDDGDSVCDDEDNCQGTFNPDQADADNDGEGDLCDYDDGLNLGELSADDHKLIKMVNVLGKEYSVHPPGELLFYIYSSGKVEKIKK